MDVTPTLKCKNEISAFNIKGTVIKFELKPPLTHIPKPNANQDEHIVEIKNENHAHDQNEQNQNALLFEETTNIKP